MITRLPLREHVEVEVVLDRQRQVLIEVVHRRIFCGRSVGNRRRNGHGKEGAGGAHLRGGRGSGGVDDSGLSGGSSGGAGSGGSGGRLPVVNPSNRLTG